MVLSQRSCTSFYALTFKLHVHSTCTCTMYMYMDLGNVMFLIRFFESVILYRQLIQHVILFRFSRRTRWRGRALEGACPTERSTTATACLPFRTCSSMTRARTGALAPTSTPSTRKTPFSLCKVHSTIQHVAIPLQITTLPTQPDHTSRFHAFSCRSRAYHAKYVQISV